MPDQQRTLVQRAAHYFGWEDRPRRSVRLNNESCVLVGPLGSRTALLYYDERHGPHGELFRISDLKRAELIMALGGRVDGV